MNRLLYIAFGIVLVVVLVLGGYYLYSTQASNSRPQNNSLVSSVAPQATPFDETVLPIKTSAPMSGPEAKKQFQSDCKETFFKDNKAVQDNANILIDSLRNNADASGPQQTIATMSLSSTADKEITDPVGQNMCLYVWFGDGTGKGHMFYQTKSGTISDLTVTSFLDPDVNSGPTPTP